MQGVHIVDLAVPSECGQGGQLGAKNTWPERGNYLQAMCGDAQRPQPISDRAVAEATELRETELHWQGRVQDMQSEAAAAVAKVLVADQVAAAALTARARKW